MKGRVLLISILAIVFSGCYEPNSGRIRTVLRENLGEEWPLTIEKGYLTCVCIGRKFPFRCTGDAITIHDPVENITYSVNGVHNPREPRKANIESIRRTDPQNPSIILDLDPLIERGLKLCP